MYYKIMAPRDQHYQIRNTSSQWCHWYCYTSKHCCIYACCIHFPSSFNIRQSIYERVHPQHTGFDMAMLWKHPPKSYPMVKGHLDQVRQNLQSTKTQKALSTTMKTTCIPVVYWMKKNHLRTMIWYDNDSNSNSILAAQACTQTRTIVSDNLKCIFIIHSFCTFALTNLYLQICN